VDEEDWQRIAGEHLVQDSEVILFARPGKLPALREALMDIMTTPIDSGFLLLHPKVKRVDRFADSVEIILTLPEGMQ
jgi:hypothetical protein